jgi:ferredoxin
MSVEITFEIDEGHGLVAEGASLWEAAKRLGVRLPADCQGRGECDACAVLVSEGSELLSPANEIEVKILGPVRLGLTERLACQTKLERPGEVVVRQSPVAPASGAKPEAGKVALPFKQKVSEFIESEAMKISAAMNLLREQSDALVGKVLNLKSQNADSTDHPDPNDSTGKS